MQPSGREMQGGGGGQDDFFDQMLSTLPAAWSELGSGNSPWELPAGGSSEDAAAFDDSAALLASRLRHHQIGGGGDKPVMLHLSDLHCLIPAGRTVALWVESTHSQLFRVFTKPNQRNQNRKESIHVFA